MSKNENEMSKEEIAEAIKNHGGNPSMTLMDSLKKGDVLDQLAAEGKVKVAKGNKGGNKVAAVAPVAPAPKFSFQKPLPKVALFLTAEEEQKVIEKERQYRADKAEALKAFATQIEHLVPDLVTSLRAFAAKPEEVQNLPGNREKDEVNRNGLADILNQEDLEAKALAVKAVSASFVLTCPKEYQQVKDLLERLVNYDFLVPLDRDQLKREEEGIYNAFGNSYKLTPTFANDPEAREIQRNMRDLVRVVKEDSRARYQNLEREFEAKNDDPMTVDNLVALVYEDEEPVKKEGTIALDIPEEKGRDREGNAFTYKPGKLLVKIGDNQLSVIEGLGGTRPVAQLLNGADTFVFLNQLQVPPKIFGENLEKNGKMSEAKQRNVKLLHRLVRAGIRNMREMAEKEAKDKAEAEAKAKAEAVAIETKAAEDAMYTKEREGLLSEVAKETRIISMEEFFLRGRPGAVSLEYLDSPWVCKDKGTDEKGVGTVKVTEFPYPGNAVAIRQDNGKIRVKCPSRLATLYQGNQEASFSTDSQFEGLEYPIWKMLQIGFGIARKEKNEADRKAREEAKAAMTETTAETGTEAQ